MKLSLLAASVVAASSQSIGMGSLLPPATSGLNVPFSAYGAPARVASPYGFAANPYSYPAAVAYAPAPVRYAPAPAPQVIVEEIILEPEVIVVEEQIPPREPATVNYEKTLNFMDMYLTQQLFTDDDRILNKEQYIWEDGRYKKAGVKSDLMQMMMFNQGMGGTGANQLLNYLLLERYSDNGNEARYFKNNGNYVLVPDTNEMFSSMMYASMGQLGPSVETMTPAFLNMGFNSIGGQFSTQNPFDTEHYSIAGMLSNVGGW